MCAVVFLELTHIHAQDRFKVLTDVTCVPRSTRENQLFQPSHSKRVICATSCVLVENQLLLESTCGGADPSFPLRVQSLIRGFA